MARIQPRYASEFARCLPLIERLRHAQRADHTRLITAVETLLATREELLIAMLRTGSPRNRRIVFDLLVRRATATDVIRDGLVNSDPVIRIMALKRTSDRATFMNAMSDRAARVRREALLHLLDDRALLECRHSRSRALSLARCANRFRRSISRSSRR